MENSSTQVLTAKLQEAISRLAAYSKETSKKLSTSPLKKTILLFKSLISDKKREKIEVLQAVDLISRERLFIQKLKEGSPAERSLADSLTQTIEAYNNSHDCHKEYEDSQNNRISKFFLKFESTPSSPLPKIDLPSEKSLKFHYPEISCSPSRIKSSSSIPLSKQAAELFQMKALALLERYGIATNPEARSIVKNSPIFTTIENETSVCILEQQLVLFPGQTIVVMGSSELNLQTQTIHKLFPGTFYISLESTQTGFPHPSQRAGWAWANQLLPESPQRPDLLNVLANFFERKKQVMTALLPHGKLLNQAKNLLRLKKQVFENNKNELIELHREYALTLLQAASSPQNKEDILSSITLFYDLLHADISPFDLLTDIHQKVRDQFIAKPHKALLDKVNTHSDKIFPQVNKGLDFETAKNILNNALKDSHHEIQTYLNLETATEKDNIIWKYIDRLAILLGPSTNQIILQYLSEDLLYIPPILNGFERKIQASTYAQAEDFMSELHAGLSLNKQTNFQWIHQKIKDDISKDMSILKSDGNLPIPNELEHYFQLRHQSL